MTRRVQHGFRHLDAVGVRRRQLRDAPAIQVFDSEPRKTFAFYVDANSNAVSILINPRPAPQVRALAAKALLSNPINYSSPPFGDEPQESETVSALLPQCSTGGVRVFLPDHALDGAACVSTHVP